MLLFFLDAWTILKLAAGAGGGGGAAQPPFANKTIRTTFPYCKNGDGICFLFIANVDGPKSSAGLTATTVTRLANPTPMIPVNVDAKSNHGRLGFRVKNCFSTIIRDQIMRTGAHYSQG